MDLRVAEFFAGVGLVRMGLDQAGFHTVWSNDFEASKQEMYTKHFGETQDHRFELKDVAAVVGGDLPDDVDLAWASFPCTDLSLAGDRRGLEGKHSSTFFEFVRVLRERKRIGRLPCAIALENVVGLATSHGGDDLRVAIASLNELGYSIDVMTLDARRFVPQSRPRLFLIGSLAPVHSEPLQRHELRPDWLQFVFDDDTLVTHQVRLPQLPPLMTTGLTELADRVPPGAGWWDDDRTEALLDSLSPIQADRLASLQRSRSVQFRTAYRRTRAGVPVWEIRADDISGCLRTARGGSSRQAVVRAGRGTVKVRWMTGREYAKLMGAPHYAIDDLRPLQVLFGFGDAVCVPAVAWLGDNYIRPLLHGSFDRTRVDGYAS